MIFACRGVRFSSFKTVLCFRSGVALSSFSPSKTGLPAAIEDVVLDVFKEPVDDLNTGPTVMSSNLETFCVNFFSRCFPFVAFAFSIEGSRLALRLGPRQGEDGTVTGRFGTFGTPD